MGPAPVAQHARPGRSPSSSRAPYSSSAHTDPRPGRPLLAANTAPGPCPRERLCACTPPGPRSRARRCAQPDPACTPLQRRPRPAPHATAAWPLLRAQRPTVQPRSPCPRRVPSTAEAPTRPRTPSPRRTAPATTAQCRLRRSPPRVTSPSTGAIDEAQRRPSNRHFTSTHPASTPVDARTELRRPHPIDAAQSRLAGRRPALTPPPPWPPIKGAAEHPQVSHPPPRATAAALASPLLP